MSGRQAAGARAELGGLGSIRKTKRKKNIVMGSVGRIRHAKLGPLPGKRVTQKRPSISGK